LEANYRGGKNGVFAPLLGNITHRYYKNNQICKEIPRLFEDFQEGTEKK
jgi:hypothetical protein